MDYYFLHSDNNNHDTSESADEMNIFNIALSFIQPRITLIITARIYLSQLYKKGI